MSNFMTVQELAKKAGLSNGRIRQLCINGILDAKKNGHAWMIAQDSALKWMNTARRWHRPSPQNVPHLQPLLPPSIKKDLDKMESVWRELTPLERESWHQFAKSGGDAWCLHCAFLECKAKGNDVS